MNEEGLITLLVCIVALMGVGDLIFMAWREVEHKKQIDTLTSKIMSRDYVQYATYKPEENKKIESRVNGEKRPRVPDPVLGTTY